MRTHQNAFPFEQLEKEFEAAHPDIDVNMEGHGSIQAVRIVSDLHEQADLVVTGEGFVDEASFQGKVVGGVVELAAEIGKNVGATIPLVARKGRASYLGERSGAWIDDEIGDEFSGDCIVAWPTAPIYTTGGIQLTMSCAGVPHQFLFVVVFYPDPNLPITPSTGTVRVHGQIVDIAESAYGYRELVVEADSVDLS